MVSVEYAEQFSVGCGNQKLWDVPGAHAFSDFVQVVAGSDGRWSGSHYLADQTRVFGVDGVEVFESASHDSVIVDHHTAGDFGVESSADRADRLLETAGWNVRVGGSKDPGLARAGTLSRPSSRDPIDLAGGVVIHVLETELKKPPRGSGAHVSKGVPAVDDNRPGDVELSGGVGVQLFEGDVQRSGKMLLRVLLGGEDLYELRAAVEELAKAVTVD
jgi:hypothetical protein